MSKPTAAEALPRLRDGNRRFVAGESNLDALASQARRDSLVDGQEPFAIILGCSDSRVPAEIVFDQGLGDLFVIRVGGNIVAPSQVGSVEFAAARFGTPLVVVMSHTQCGVVTAALDSAIDGANDKSRNLRSLVDRVRPAVLAAVGSQRHASVDRAAVVHEAVRINVRASADHLRHGSALLEGLIRDRGLAVVGAEYLDRIWRGRFRRPRRGVTSGLTLGGRRRRRARLPDRRRLAARGAYERGVPIGVRPETEQRVVRLPALVTFAHRRVRARHAEVAQRVER